MKHFITLIITVFIFWGCSAVDQPNETEFTVAAGNVSRSTIAIDTTTGTIYVAWISTNESVSNVYLSRLKPGESEFSKPVRVNHIKGQAGSHSQAPPQVAVSPRGLVYVAWTNPIKVEGHKYPLSDIYIARSEDGGQTFSPGVDAVVNKPSYPTSQNFHDIAIGPEGTVYVSWLDGRAGGKPGEATSHQAHKPDGHQMHHAGMQVRLARSTNQAQSFSPGKIVARHTCQCCRTAVAVGDDGNVYLVWRHIFGDNIRDMAIARSKDEGKSFTDLVRIHNDGWQLNGCPHAGPSVVVDNKGNTFAFWYTGAKGKAGVYMAKAEGGELNFGQAISLPGGKATSQVEADVNDRGDVWFAWENYSKSTIQIGNYVDSNIDKSFATIHNGGLPSISVSDKYAAITWLASDSVKVRVYNLTQIMHE